MKSIDNDHDDTGAGDAPAPVVDAVKLVADWLVVMHEKGDLRIITAPAIDMRSGQLGAFIFAANGPASAGLYAWAKVGEMLVADGVDLQRYANDLRTGIEDARKTAKKRGGAEPSSS